MRHAITRLTQAAARRGKHCANCGTYVAYPAQFGWRCPMCGHDMS